MKIYCKICNKEIYITPYYFNKKKCCSSKCGNIWKSKITKGRKKSEEWKRKIGEGNKGKKRAPFSKEWINKMSKSHKGLIYKKKKYIISHGYKLVYLPKHPFCDSKKYFPEHRLVMEKHLGRYLKSEEVVHHINRNTMDNRIENLKFFKNNSEHIREHRLSYLH